MTFDSYQMQVLVAIGKGCKPNSPKRHRAWMEVRPLYGVPEFGNALSSLVRAGLLQRGVGYRVKPSVAGYRLILQWRIRRRELKLRPVLFDRCIWDQPIELKIAA